VLVVGGLMLDGVSALLVPSLYYLFIVIHTITHTHTRDL